MDPRTANLFSIAALLTTTLALLAVNAAPVSINHAEIYLSQYGYLSPKARNPSSGGNLLAQESWETAIREFQGFAGLNVTGELDEETTELMSMPRCGVKDKVGFGSDSRSKRYALQGSRWKVKALTYRISKYPKRLNRDDVDKEVAKAFAVWSEYTELTFTAKKSNPVHIDIRFETGEHGDGDPFDGPGGTLAHAYFPVYGGDAHFDDAEQWTINSARGTNLFQVAAHEFGHSLGLSHSDVRSALMAPFYRGYDPVFRLDSDDIQGIQALYGRKSSGSSGSGSFGSSGGSGTSAKTTKAPTVSRDNDALCSNSKIDAVFNTGDGATYAFQGDKYYRLTENAVADGYPKAISEGWPGLPNNIDAAFTYKNGKTYFFKGSKYWRYNGRTLDGEYPKEINEGFTGIPNNVDAAMVWGGNGKIYFYKGSKFWRFDPLKRPPVKSTYPKPLSNWEGIPDGIDAALQYTNGYTYFFKGDKYYRFNDRTFAIDAAEPPFPRPTAHWWFGCKNSPSQFSGNLESEVRGSSEDAYGNFDADGEGAPHDSQKDENNSSSVNTLLISVLLPAILLSISQIIRH